VPETLHLLQYEYGGGDVAARRAPHRPAHLDLIKAYEGDGRLVIAGAVGDPPRSGLLAFRSPDAAEAFVADDPYVSSGLVESWRVEPWTVVTALP